jgi:hypothetical protein
MVVVDKALAFVRSWLSEPDGTISNARICVVIVICFATGWMTALLSKVHGAVTVPELTAFVGQLGMYVSGICAALYGVNKFADAYKNRADREGPPPQQAGDPPAQQ